MTDRPPSDAPGAPQDLPEVDPIFGLASALHDGEATDAGRARGDAEVDRELRVIGAISRRVAEVPPAPEGLVDDHVAAALAAFAATDAVPPAEVLAPSAAPAEPGGRVTTLAARRPWWQRAPLGAVAAGVAVVALVGAIGFAAVGDGDDDTAATALATDDAESSPGAARTEEAEAFDTAGGGAGGSALAAGERAAYATFDELAVALVDRAAAPAAPPDQTTSEASADAAPGAEARSGAEGDAGCDAVGAAGIDPAAIELVVVVVVDGQLVTAVVHDAAGERRLTSVDEATCAVVDQRPL